MKSISYLSPICLLLLLIASCEKENNQIDKPKTYWDYSDFITDGLVAYYPMNGNANDSSGNNINGVINGSIPSIDRFGDTLGSYMFDGLDDFIEIPNKPQINGNAGSICFWVRVPDPSESLPRAILSKADTGRYGYVLSVSGYSYYWWWRTRETSGLVESAENTGADFWTEGRYFFIGITYTENSLAYYFEGELRASKTYSPEIIFNNNNQVLYIGKSLVSLYHNFKGEIDDILIYNRALTDTEVMQLYNWKID
jgi:hypothetical protein